ncbi:MAG: hypothetical protein M3Q14_04550 [bacterium]|nr:hypothetical protein [bacterium]
MLHPEELEATIARLQAIINGEPPFTYDVVPTAEQNEDDNKELLIHKLAGQTASNTVLERVFPEFS